MTEAEYLTSEDPAAMLDYLGTGPADSTGAQRKDWTAPSGRKLRLWVEACRAIRTKLAEDRWGYNLDDPVQLVDAVREWATSHRDVVPAGSVRTALLREIIGNPFAPHPFALKADEIARRLWRWRYVPRRDATFPQLVPPWLTEQAEVLARGAAEPGEDGVLDGQCLLVLADCLEEAGCTHEGLLRHLRGQERCRYCSGHGAVLSTYSFPVTACRCCEGTGWRSLPVPHVHGCWAVDLVPGLE